MIPGCADRTSTITSSTITIWRARFHDEGIKDILVTLIGDLTMVGRTLLGRDGQQALGFIPTTPRASAGTSRISRNRSPT